MKRSGLGWTWSTNISIAFEARVEQISSRFQQIDDRFQQMESRFDQLAGHLDVMESTLQQILLRLPAG